MSEKHAEVCGYQIYQQMTDEQLQKLKELAPCYYRALAPYNARIMTIVRKKKALEVEEGDLALKMMQCKVTQLGLMLEEKKLQEEMFEAMTRVGSSIPGSGEQLMVAALEFVFTHFVKTVEQGV